MEQFDDQDVYIPLGSTRQFSCASKGSSTLQWAITVTGSDDDFTGRELNDLPGVNISSRTNENGSMISVLTLNTAELMDNIAAIKCRISNVNIRPIVRCLREAIVFVFGEITV